MAGMSNLGAHSNMGPMGMGPNVGPLAAVNAGPQFSAPYAVGPGCPFYGPTTTGAILVLFILLVIITRAICV